MRSPRSPRSPATLVALTIAPQLLLFAGNALGAADGLDWIGDNAGDLPRIVASGLILCVTFGALGIVVASYAERRAFSLISVVAIFLISFTVVGIVVSEFGNDQTPLCALPQSTARGRGLDALSVRRASLAGDLHEGRCAERTGRLG